jgi:hypothetical protein
MCNLHQLITHLNLTKIKSYLVAEYMGMEFCDERVIPFVGVSYGRCNAPDSSSIIFSRSMMYMGLINGGT